MNKQVSCIAVALLLSAGMVASAQAVTTTLNFDDIDTASGIAILHADYGGLTWDSGAADHWGGNYGRWIAWSDSTFATAHSGQNFLFNGAGPQELGFTLPTPAESVSAWFSLTTNGTDPGPLELVGYVGGVETYHSASLVLTSTPQLLSLVGSGITRVTVRGSSANWYAMDDLTIQSAVPEPSGTLSALIGMSAIAGWARARRRSQAASLPA